MKNSFKIQYSSHFRKSIKLFKKNHKLKDDFDYILTILEVDPFNLSRVHDIKKLTDTIGGEGQWRIRVGKYRLRYDIVSQYVILYTFKHRKDAY